MNFSFLNPAFLWAIPISFIPLVLHLLIRRPPRTVLFSDLRFLKSIYQRSRPKKKIREWLLLLFRMLTLACLLLFFTRPVMHRGKGAFSRQGDDTVAMVVLLDSSYSMGAMDSGLSLWDRSLRLLGKTMALLRNSDRSALIVFSEKIDYSSGYLTNDHHKLNPSSLHLHRSFGGTNILPALQQAYQLLSNSPASNKVILVLSDMARHGWAARDGTGAIENFEPMIKNFEPSVRVLYSNLAPVRQNVAVENAELEPDPYTGTMKVNVRIKNEGDGPVSDLPVFLNFDTQGGMKRLSEMIIALGPMEEKDVALSAPISGQKIYLGEVGIRPDPLKEDDLFYFAAPAPRQYKVLIAEEPAGLSALSGESYYLRQALSAPPPLFDVRTITMDELKIVPLGQFQTVVLVNPGILDPESEAALLKYRIGGGSLLVTCGERSSKLFGNSPLLGSLPCTLGAPRDLERQETTPSSDEDLLKFKQDYDWEKISVTKVVQGFIKDNGTAAIVFGDGTPLLIFSGDNKSSVWLSTIDRSWNNFAGRPIFAPLMRYILKRLGSNLSAPAGVGARSGSLRIGESYRRERSGGIRKESVSLTSPSGEKVEIRFLDREMISSPLLEPGFYNFAFWDGEKQTEEKFAANIESRKGESDCHLISASDLHTVLPKAAFLPLHAGEEYESECSAALRGKELSRPLLALAGVFLLGETLLSSRSKRAADERSG